MLQILDATLTWHASSIPPGRRGSERAREPWLEPASRGRSGLGGPRVPLLAPVPEPLRCRDSRSQPPARTRAPPGWPGRLQFSAGLRLDSSCGRGGAGRDGWGVLRDHVIGVNMAAPSGVHLLVRRGKHLENSSAGFCSVALSLSTRVQRGYTPALKHFGAHGCNFQLYRYTQTHRLTRTRRRNRHIYPLVICLDRVTAWHLFAVTPWGLWDIVWSLLPHVSCMISVANLLILAVERWIYGNSGMRLDTHCHRESSWCLLYLLAWYNTSLGETCNMWLFCHSDLKWGGEEIMRE